MMRHVTLLLALAVLARASPRGVPQYIMYSVSA